MKSKVTCPKCGETYIYEFIPGASFDSVRLGNYRFMKCKKCGKWGFFNIIEHLPSKQKRMIGVFNIFFGIILGVLSILGFFNGLSLHKKVLEVIGIVVFVFALFLFGTGISAWNGAKN